MADQSLADRLRAAMNEARKQRDQARTLLLSTILADIKNREIELNKTPTDDETAEIKALEAFLPAAVAAEEIRAAVRETIAGGASDIGKVMGAVMPRFKGRADGKLVNQIAREELAGSKQS